MNSIFSLGTLVPLSLFFLNDTATPEISPLPLHDALPISPQAAPPPPGRPRPGARGAGAALAAARQVPRLPWGELHPPRGDQHYAPGNRYRRRQREPAQLRRHQRGTNDVDPGARRRPHREVARPRQGEEEPPARPGRVRLRHDVSVRSSAATI